MDYLERYKSNRLTELERVYRLEKLNDLIQKGEVDQEFVDYLKIINEFTFLVTTQCCCGHNEGKGGRRAHLDFRSKLSEANTIDLILRPLQDKTGCSIELMTENDRLRYVVWFENHNWRESVEILIKILRYLNTSIYINF